jgi:hypothetical protein
MNKIRCYIVNFYRLITVISIVFTTWKFACYWQRMLAEKTNHGMDASIGGAEKKLKKTSAA